MNLDKDKKIFENEKVDYSVNQTINHYIRKTYLYLDLAIIAIFIELILDSLKMVMKLRWKF